MRKVLAVTPGADFELSRLLHVDLALMQGWLDGKHIRPRWQLTRIMAALDFGLVLHPGLPPDPPIPFDPDIDVEWRVFGPQNEPVGQGR